MSATGRTTDDLIKAKEVNERALKREMEIPAPLQGSKFPSRCWLYPVTGPSGLLLTGWQGGFVTHSVNHGAGSQLLHRGAAILAVTYTDCRGGGLQGLIVLTILQRLTRRIGYECSSFGGGTACGSLPDLYGC